LILLSTQLTTGSFLHGDQNLDFLKKLGLYW